MNIKTNTINKEFDLLLKSGMIAFYNSCEITQFYIIDKRSNEVANFYWEKSFSKSNSKKNLNRKGKAYFLRNSARPIRHREALQGFPTNKTFTQSVPSPKF